MAENITVCTIGFTKTTAQKFFLRLTSAEVKTVVDVRLHNTSQLSGFAKADDLAFFLKKIGNINYRHEPLLAPEDKMLDDYKKKKMPWNIYEAIFMDLMAIRRIEDKINPTCLEGACLLCSEDTPHHCHRRLVCDYLNQKWGRRLAVRHL